MFPIRMMQGDYIMKSDIHSNMSLSEENKNKNSEIVLDVSEGSYFY